MTDRPKIEWSDDALRSANALADKNVLPGIISCQPNLTWLRAFLSNLPAYSAAECREREREACHKMLSSLDKWQLYNRHPDAVIDRLFPSLTPPPPPALRLSTGEWTRKVYRSHGSRLLWSAPTDSMLCSYPKIVTASDARALAEWLAKYGSEEERK